MAPQLKRAWASLIIGLTFFLIVIGGVISYEPINFLDNASQKKFVYGLIILGVSLYGIVVLLFRSKEKGITVINDERDRKISMKSMKYQLWVRTIVLMVWMISLIETYEYQHSIPLVFPFFIFITSTLGINNVFIFRNLLS